MSLITTGSPLAQRDVATSRIVVAWPRRDATLSGLNVFQGYVPNLAPQDYTLYWQLDGGPWQKMQPVSPHDTIEEATVNVDAWRPVNQRNHIVSFLAVSGRNQRIIDNVPVKVLPRSSIATPSPTATPKASPALIGKSAAMATVSGASTNNALITTQLLYVNPNSDAMRATQTRMDPESARLVQKIANTPTAIWLGGWSGDVQAAANSITADATQKNQVPMLVAYNIPNRDCGGYSGGGAASYTAYGQWISRLAAGIGGREAIVVVEPDALAQSSCLGSSLQQQRLNALASAVTTLKANPRTHVYIDAGDPYWLAAPTAANLLKQANVGAADGFSLNVSNFIDTPTNIAYGSQISSLVGGKHFIIDTSRNGRGYNGQWCNPPGRALGAASTLQTGNALVDGLLWIKAPGESDGTCGGGPAAGTWWLDYALMLARNAGW